MHKPKETLEIKPTTLSLSGDRAYCEMHHFVGTPPKKTNTRQKKRKFHELYSPSKKKKNTEKMCVVGVGHSLVELLDALLVSGNAVMRPLYPG